MNKSITGSLIVCASAALFTVGALVVNSGAPNPTAGVTPSSSTAAGGAPPVPTSPYGAAPPRTGGTLTIQDLAFGPASAGPGARLTIDNRDGVAHTVSHPDGLFDSGAITANRVATLVAPATPGTYRFVCLIHPQMAGTLVVR